MELNDARNLLGQHWSAFVGAVFDPEVRAQPGGVQSYVWASLNTFYLSRGETPPPGSFQAVNALLSLAGEQYRAQATLGQALSSFGRTGTDRAIDANMISRAVDAAPLGSQPLGPQYRITYEAMAMVEGQPVFLTLTHDAGYDLPQSLSGLQDLVDAAAPVALSDYDFEFGGVATPAAILAY